MFELAEGERRDIDAAVNRIFCGYHADDHLLIRAYRQAEHGDNEAGREHDEHGGARRAQGDEGLMPDLTWDNAEDIGIALFERYPDVDPLAVRFTDLHKWVSPCRL